VNTTPTLSAAIARPRKARKRLATPTTLPALLTALRVQLERPFTVPVGYYGKAAV
jgi:hypothetical protein